MISLTLVRGWYLVLRLARRRVPERLYRVTRVLFGASLYTWLELLIADVWDNAAQPDLVIGLAIVIFMIQFFLWCPNEWLFGSKKEKK